MTPNECRSGELYEFYGVVLGHATWRTGPEPASVSVADSLVLRVVDDPLQGWRVALAERGDVGPPLVLTAKDCRFFDIGISAPYAEPTKYGHVPGRVSGSVGIDCKMPGGGSLSATVRFAQCGPDWELDD